MELALHLAVQGEGRVEPNPMVGCVLVCPDSNGGTKIGEGFHQQYGGPHAEVNAIQNATSLGHETKGATAYVTLEPCSHTGKTGPCADALIQAGIQRLVVAQQDPFPEVAGRGLGLLRESGVTVEVGVMAELAEKINAPYLKRLATGLPWVIAKWAMTLDGKIATATGDSQWISGIESRRRVHEIRSRVDGVLVGIGTALADDPRLTARWIESESEGKGEEKITNGETEVQAAKRSPSKKQQNEPWPQRVATRIVVDSKARLPLDSKLAQSATEAPVLIAVGPEADGGQVRMLAAAGCEIWRSETLDSNARLKELMAELGSRGMTNVLVEGGGQLLAACFELQLIDEVQAFIAPKIVGGQEALTAVEGNGIQEMAGAIGLDSPTCEMVGRDVLVTAVRSKPKWDS